MSGICNKETFYKFLDALRELRQKLEQNGWLALGQSP